MILLTGATGFVGSAVLFKLLEEKEVAIRTYGRRSLSALGNSRNLSIEQICGPITSDTDYSLAFKDISVVIHCAARVHLMQDDESNPLLLYREVNTEGTLNLAKQAVNAGIKRFIFVSSIKVNGESTELGKSFTYSDIRSPQDPYGVSKSEAEHHLIELSKETGLELVIIRPTLVYGPGVKANFASLMNLVSKGIPLPFGCITQNKRSLVSVTNLVDLIITCIDHPKAANQVFLVSDDHDVSTSEMVHEMAKALDKPSMQLPIPIWCYKLAGKLFNKSDVVDRLTGSLQVDISHTKQTLGWKPPQTLQEGFKQTAQAFLQAKTK
ncbi:SDR family oxidoreductase [Shewanella sp. GD04112]|uniref:UDP-glucose 4-epimerase family protein n=1 Tax=Shewanella sp. GD04112 TaxID=2975434 RepID=UPI002449D65C|nr:SDR family oxidoreductase [Shewanella sp. GD04112]MDH0447940.1 SDR family oxidoreductase [Shewanella sp. GD04112]